MKRLLLTLFLLLGVALAQQEATVSGIIKTEDEMPEGTRVSIHVVDRDNVWQREVASVAPVGGTFSITTTPVPAEELQPFRSGAVLLPGLQNEYTVTPEDANYTQGRINMYVDANANGVFDRVADAFYIGVPSLKTTDAVGFFSLIYVDRDVTVTGKGIDLNLKEGWNVFSLRLPNEGAETYAISQNVDDAVLDVFLPKAPGQP